MSGAINKGSKTKSNIEQNNLTNFTDLKDNSNTLDLLGHKIKNNTKYVQFIIMSL